MVNKSTINKRVDDSVWYAIAATRILLGLIFLWAFFDKLFGLGFATPATKAWIAGGSPTMGFLKSVEGPFADFFNSLASMPIADWLFMIGLLAIGAGLLKGIAVRLSVVTGTVLLFMMWLASLPLKNNPIIDDHIVYIAVLLVIGLSMNHQKWSFAPWWQKLPIVKDHAWLK